MWKRTVIIAAAVCGVFAGVLSFLTSDRVADAVRLRAMEWAREELALNVHIRRLQLGFLPPQITLVDVRAQPLNDNADCLKLRGVSARVLPWPSSTGSLIVNSLAVDGLDLDLNKLDSRNSSEPSLGKTGVDIRHIHLRDSRISFSTPKFGAELKNIELTMTPHARKQRRIALQIGSGTLTVNQRSLDFSARLNGELKGTVERPEVLVLSSSTVTLAGISMDANGELDLNTAVPNLNLSVKSKLELAQLNEILPAVPPLKGHALPNVRIVGPWTRPELRLTMAAEETHISNRYLGRVTLTSLLINKRLRVESFEIDHPRGGRITGSGVVHTDGASVSGFARIHEARMEEVLEEIGLQDSHVRLLLDADAQFSGSLKPFQLSIATRGTVKEFQVLDSSHKNAYSPKRLNLRPTPLNSQFTIESDQVTIEELQLGPDEAAFAVDGVLHYSTGMALRLRAENAALEWLGPVAGIEYGGEATIEAKISGPYRHPLVSSTIEATDFSMQDYSLGATRTTLMFDHPTLQLNRVRIQRGQGELRGSGLIRFADGAQLNISAELDQLGLSSVFRDLRLPNWLSDRVEGVGTGKLVVKGDAKRPIGSVSAISEEVRYDGVSLGEMTLKVGFGGESERLWCQVGLVQQKSLVDTRFGWKNDDNMAIEGNFKNVPLSSMKHLLANEDIGGALNGKFSLLGPLQALDGTASAEFHKLSVAKTKFGNGRFRAHIAKGDATIDGTLLDRAITAEGALRLNKDVPFNLSASFEDLEATRMLDFGPSIESQLTGSIFAQGSLLRPSGIQADLRVERWRLKVANEQLRASRTINLGWAGQTLIIPEAEFTGPDASLSISGQVPRNAAMKLSVEGDASLSAFARFSEFIERGDGRFRFALRIGGDLDEPSIRGEVLVKDGELTLAGQTQPATGIQSRLVFNGSSVGLDSTQFEYGGGLVNLGGQIDLPSREPAEASIRANFEGIAIKPSTDIDAIVSGSLRLLGPRNKLRLRGSVQVDELTYSRNIDLTSIIPRRGSQPPINIPAAERTNPIELAIKVSANESVLLKNNVLDARLSANLTLTGTTNRMGLLGTVTPVSARARYAGNLFKLDHGSIDFTEEYEVFSRFSLRASTQACQMNVTVDIFGDSESYSISPSGSDERGIVDPQEVLLCLQFGARQRFFTASGTLDQNSAVGGINDERAAAVSGIDALWTVSGLNDRVREVLPIDEVRITNAWSAQVGGIRPRLVLGKDIGEALRLQYWQSIRYDNREDEESDRAVTVQYQLSRNSSLEGSWFSASQIPVDFGLDLRLRWELR